MLLVFLPVYYHILGCRRALRRFSLSRWSVHREADSNARFGTSPHPFKIICRVEDSREDSIHMILCEDTYGPVNTLKLDLSPYRREADGVGASIF